MKPAWGSSKKKLSLHLAKTMPLGETAEELTLATSCHVSAPSVVLQSCIPWKVHWEPGTPGHKAQPFVSSLNDSNEPFPPSGKGADVRCCHVWPSSVDRNRY